jgi:hypothetical protein
MSATAGREHPDHDPLPEQLLHQAKAIAELRRDLDRLAHETTDTITAIHDQLSEFSTDEAAARARGSTAWSWRDIGPQAEEELWNQLITWVRWLRSRYPLARKIPDCWQKHPEVVEELTALWLAWQAAYTDRDAILTAPIDWHDRWLPGVLHRLEHGPFALDCTNRHQKRPESTYAVAHGHPTLTTNNAPQE